MLKLSEAYSRNEFSHRDPELLLSMLEPRLERNAS